MKLNEIKLSTRQMLLDIGTMLGNAKSLLSKSNEYNHLLRFIVKIEYFREFDGHFPSIKELSQITGIKYDIVRKQIRAIYEDLIFGEDDGGSAIFSIKKVNYSFTLRGLHRDRYISFKMDKLPVELRIGETIEIPYFKAFLGSTYFYVENVIHSFYNEQQEVQYILRYGTYNKWWDMRKDEALMKREISLNDLFEKDDWELKKMIL